MHKNLAYTFIFAFLALLLIDLPIDLLASEEGGHAGPLYTTERWQDFGIRIMNFVVFFFILFFLLRKPVKNFFQSRKENISRTLEYLETQATNLEEQNQVLQKKLSQLSVERDTILAQYERDGAKERDRIIAEAHKTADQIIKKTEIAMEQELKIAKRRLANESGLLATKIAEELLVENITDEDKSRIMLEFVANVTKLPARH
jgi:F-type H+-transporting ATPase subunit b